MILKLSEKEREDFYKNVLKDFPDELKPLANVRWFVQLHLEEESAPIVYISHVYNELRASYIDKALFKDEAYVDWISQRGYVSKNHWFKIYKTIEERVLASLDLDAIDDKMLKAFPHVLIDKEYVHD